MKFLIWKINSLQLIKEARFIWHQSPPENSGETASKSPKPPEAPLAEIKLSAQDLVNAIVKTEQTPGKPAYHMSNNEYLIMNTLLGDQVTIDGQNISFGELMGEKNQKDGKAMREKIQISLESLKKVALKHPAEYAKIGNAIENLVSKKYGADKAKLAHKHIEASQQVVATHTQEMLETTEEALINAERIEYTVKAGDNLSVIGKAHGIPRVADLVYFHNTIAAHDASVTKIDNIHAIKVGQKIMIPQSTAFALRPAIQAARKLAEDHHPNALKTLKQAELEGAKQESSRIAQELQRVKDDAKKAGDLLTPEQKNQLNLRVHTAEAALAAGETAEAIQLLESMMGSDRKIGALAAIEHDSANVSYKKDTSIFKHIPLLSSVTYSTESGILSFFDKNNSWEKAYNNLSKEDQILYANASKTPFEDLKNYTDPNTADDYNFGSKLMKTLLLTAGGNAVSIPSSILISSALTGNPTLVVSAYVGRFDLGMGQREIVSTPEAQLQPLGQFLFYTGKIKELKEELPEKKKAIDKAGPKDRPALESEYKHLESLLSDYLGRLQMLINGIELEKAERLKEAISANYEIERDNDGKIVKISRTAPLEDRPNDNDLAMLRVLEPKDAQEYSRLIKEFRAAEAEHKKNTSDTEKQQKMSQAWTKVVEFLNRTIESNTQKIASSHKAKLQELPRLLAEQKQARLNLKKAIENNDQDKIKELSAKLKSQAFIDRRSIPQRLKEAEQLIEKSAQTRDTKRIAITHTLAEGDDTALIGLKADEKTVQARLYAEKQAEETYISGQQIRAELGDQFSDLARNPFVDFFLPDIKISHEKIAEAKAKLQPQIAEKTATRDKFIREFMIGSLLENYPDYLGKKDYPSKEELHQRHLNLYQLKEGGQAYDPTRENTNYLVVLSCLLGERATHEDRQALIHLQNNVYQATMSDLENAYEKYYLEPKAKGRNPVKSRGAAIGKSDIMEGPQATAGLAAEAYEPVKDILLQDIFPVFEAAGVQNIRADLPKLEKYLTENPSQKQRLVKATERLFYASRNYQTAKMDRELSQLQQKQKAYDDFDRELSVTKQGETTVKKALETIKEDEKLDAVITLLAETDIPNEAELRKDANELGKILEASKPIHKDLVDLGNLDQDARISPQVVPLFRSVYAKMQALHAPAQAALQAIYESVYQKKAYDSEEFHKTHLAEIQKMFTELQAEHKKLQTELKLTAAEAREKRTTKKREEVIADADLLRKTAGPHEDYGPAKSIDMVFQPHLAELLKPDVSVHKYNEIKDIIEKGLSTVTGYSDPSKLKKGRKDIALEETAAAREVMINLICERINSLGEKTVPVPMTPDMFRNPDGTFDPVGAAKTYEILNRVSQLSATNPSEIWKQFKDMMKKDYALDLIIHDTPATTGPYQMANQDLLDGTPARYLNMIMMQLPGVDNKQAMRETMLRTLSELGLHIDEVQLMQAMSKAKPVVPGELPYETINTGNLSGNIPYYPLESNKNAHFKLDGGYKLEFPRKVHISEIQTTDNKIIKIDKDVEITYNIYLRGKCFNVNIPRQDLLKAVSKVTRKETIIPPEEELAGINITTEVPGTTQVHVPIYWASIGGGEGLIDKTETGGASDVPTPTGGGGTNNPTNPTIPAE